MDIDPYTTEVYRLQQRYQNLYGSRYVRAAGLRPFRLMDEEEDKSSARLDERQINTNRNVAFDFLMENIRAGSVGYDCTIREDLRDTFRKQLRDMKRVRAASPKISPDTERYQWVKSEDGNDHFHHALLYCWLAARLRLAARPTIVLPPSLLMTKMRLKNPL